MVKVLHLINYPGRGGSERYILTLAEKLHNKECIFYLGYSQDGPMLEEVRKLGIKACNIPMSSPYDLRAAKMVKDICRDFSIDIVHTHFLRENYISVFSKVMGNKAAVINTNHLLTSKGLVLKLSNRFMTRLNDRLIAVSSAVVEQMLAEGIKPEQVKLIYNGVDIGYWKGKRGSRVRKELNIDRNDFVVTSIARFAEEKGHVFLLEAIKVFQKTFLQDPEVMPRKVRFVLVGEGELFEECKKLAAMMGIYNDITFTGFRSDIKSILYDSDLFVSHSESEALGLSILEALCCKLPVVASNSGGPSEIVNEENNCGLLVEYGDVEGMAEAIYKFVTNKKFYTTCKANAYKTVEEKFNLDKTAEETYNLYKEVGGRQEARGERK